MIRTTVRTATRRHACTCGQPILPGEKYIESVASPWSEDIENPKWWRLHECASCAARYGRPIEGVDAPHWATL